MADSTDDVFKEPSPAKLHDAFFRDMMTNRKVQRQFLENYLPASLKEGLDWDKLRNAPDHFVTADWSHRNADLLFELHRHGQTFYFYLLLEHQSKPDPLMPLRLLEYQIQIWRRHIKKHRNHRLPYIHAMVFYTGKDAYRYSLSIKELIDGPADLVEALWNQPFALIDLKQQDFTRLANYAHLSALLGGFRMQFLPSESELVQVLAEIQGNLPLVDAELLFDILLKYLFHLRDDVEPERLAEEASKQNVETLRSRFMSVAQRLIKKGFEDGVDIGMEKGVNIGIEKGVNIGIEKGVNIGIEKGVNIGIKKGVDIGIEKGVNIGVDKGRAMRDRELVQQFFSTGQDVDTIAKLLGLELSTVQRYLIVEAPSDQSE